MQTVNVPLGGLYEEGDTSLIQKMSTNLSQSILELPGGLSQVSLRRTPGIEASLDIGSGVGRGFIKVKSTDSIYLVNGNQLFFMNSLNTFTLLGDIAGAGRCTFAENGVTMVIQPPGLTGYFLDLTTHELNIITDATYLENASRFPGGILSVSFADARFIYASARELFVGSPHPTTALDLGRAFDPLAFEDVFSASDPLVRVMRVKDELVAFSTESIDKFSNVGTTPFPYRRVPGATINKGLRSRFSVILIEETFMWLGNGPFDNTAIYAGGSGTAIKISNKAIDSAIQSYSIEELSAVVAYSWGQDGDFFAAWSFPNETFVYNSTASKMSGQNIWHRIESPGRTVSIISDVVSSLGNTLVQTTENGILGILSRSATQEFGVSIKREFSTDYVYNESNVFLISRVELAASRGTGVSRKLPLDADPQERPVMALTFSIDGGNTYKDAGTVSMGNFEEYLKRIQFYRIGRVPYSILFNFRSDEMGVADIQRLDIDITPGIT